MSISIGRFFKASNAGAGVRFVQAGLASAGLGLALIGNPAFALTQSVSTADIAVSKLRLPPATGTIHWGVKRNGSIELSDRPVSGPDIVRQGVQTYSTASDSESLARAKRERDYWREQSEAFSKRQQQRDEEIERTRQARALAGAEASAYGSGYPYYIVPRYYGGGYGVGGPGWGGRPIPQPANPVIGLGGGAPTLGSPEAAALGGGPSPFLSSGFARNLHR